MRQTCYNCHGHGCSYCGDTGKEDNDEKITAANKIQIKHIEECPIIYGSELAEEEKKDFDYWKPDELNEQRFAKYRGNIYDISQFIRFTYGMTAERIRDGYFHPFGREWDYGGYHSDSFYNGILCLIVDDETVKMATYMS